MRIIYSFLAILAFASPLYGRVSCEGVEGLTEFERVRLDLERSGVMQANLPFAKVHADAAVRETIIVVHGIGESPRGVQEVADYYFERGFNVVVPLLEGHGHTDGAALHRAKAESWRKNIDEAIDVAKDLGSKVRLVGFSLGGVLSVDAAHRHRGDIASVELIAPPLKLSERVEANLNARASEGKEFTTDAPLTGNPYSYSLVSLTAFQEAIRFAAVVRSNLGEGESLPMPVTVVYSEADPLIDQPTLDKFIQAQHAKTFKFEKNRRVGHTGAVRWHQEISAGATDYEQFLQSTP